MSIKDIVMKNKLARAVYLKIQEYTFEIATAISPTLNTKLRYRVLFKKKLDLNHPTTLNEKVLWLKLNRYMNDPLVIQCADKVAVRQYVKDCGCEDILTDVIGIYDRAEDIPWDELPNRFILKWNFGAGMNLVCTDKNKMKRDAVINQMRRWGKNKYWLSHSEMQYKYIPKKIICEHLLNDLPMEGDKE